MQYSKGDNMKSIELTKDELRNLYFPTYGDECYIGVYRKPNNSIYLKNYSLLRGKIIRVYKDEEELTRNLGVSDYNSYIENKQAKILEFSKLNPEDFKVLNVPLGPVYLDKEFYGSFQNIIFNAESLSDKCYDQSSSDYTNLKLITSFISQIQAGVMFELHPNNIYTDDLHNSNILVDKNNQIHFIDADSFRINDYHELNHFIDNGMSKEEYNSYYSELPLNKKYLENGVFRASKQRDIYFIYAHFIELVTKASLTYLNSGMIYELLQKANFPNDFIDEFSICFRSHKDNEFINEDILDRISTDYKMERCRDARYHTNDSIYIGCKLVKKQSHNSSK